MCIAQASASGSGSKGAEWFVSGEQRAQLLQLLARTPFAPSVGVGVGLVPKEQLWAPGELHDEAAIECASNVVIDAGADRLSLPLPLPLPFLPSPRALSRLLFVTLYMSETRTNVWAVNKYIQKLHILHITSLLVM